MAEIIPGSGSGSGIDFDHPDRIIQGIPVFTERDGLLESLSSANGGEIQKNYFCRWGDRYRLANLMVGFASVSGGRGGAISFNHPYSLPESPNLFTTRVTLKGIGAYQNEQSHLNVDAFGAAFPLCRVTAWFNVLPYPTGLEQNQNTAAMGIDDATSGMIYASQDLSIGGEPMEIPASALRYSFDGGATPYRNSKSMVIQIRHASLRLTFYQLPYFPTNALKYYVCVNDKYEFLGGAKGTVKFAGAEVHRDYQSGGTVQTLTNHYEYRPVSDWNYVPNPFPDDVPSIRARVSHAADDSDIFPYKDLTETFPNAAYGGGS